MKKQPSISKLKQQLKQIEQKHKQRIKGA